MVDSRLEQVKISCDQGKHPLGSLFHGAVVRGKGLFRYTREKKRKKRNLFLN